MKIIYQSRKFVRKITFRPLSNGIAEILISLFCLERVVVRLGKKNDVRKKEVFVSRNISLSSLSIISSSKLEGTENIKLKLNNCIFLNL